MANRHFTGYDVAVDMERRYKDNVFNGQGDCIDSNQCVVRHPGEGGRKDGFLQSRIDTVRIMRDHPGGCDLLCQMVDIQASTGSCLLGSLRDQDESTKDLYVGSCLTTPKWLFRDFADMILRDAHDSQSPSSFACITSRPKKQPAANLLGVVLQHGHKGATT